VRRRELMLLVGGALTSAHSLRAQQKAMPVIGFLNSRSPGEAASIVTAFRQGLSETGWIEGQSVAIEYRWDALIGCPQWPPTSSAARST
jgi:putative tryptophan/tyrosine transport system substrate-binding protein